jgi:hypothetical protein
VLSREVTNINFYFDQTMDWTQDLPYSRWACFTITPHRQFLFKFMSVTCDRSVVFSGYSGFLRHDITEILLKVVLNTINPNITFKFVENMFSLKYVDTFILIYFTTWRKEVLPNAHNIVELCRQWSRISVFQKIPQDVNRSKQ